MKRIAPFCILIVLLGMSHARAVDGSLTLAVVCAKGKGDTQNSGDGALTGKIIHRLSGYGYLKLVERERLDLMLKEQALGQLGVVDEASAAKAGRAAGADVIVIVSGGDACTLRAVHAESMRLLATAKAAHRNEVPAAADSIAFDLGTHLARENLKRMRNDNSAIRLEFRAEVRESISTPTREWTGSGYAKSGGTVSFIVRSDTDGYITIIDIQPDGEVVMLYPNDYHPSNKITAGKTFTIPGKDDGFVIHFTKPAGTDTVVAFFTRRPVQWLDRQALTGSGLLTVRKSERVAVARGMSITATKIAPSEWKSACIEIDVRE